MRPTENYLPLVATAAALTFAVLAAFEVYVLREPTRIAADEGRDRQAATASGGQLFARNCATCHGEHGEGSEDGPALNSRQLLNTTSDATIFSVVSSGVPNTKMPAWNQRLGGPLTDDEIRQLSVFIRAWQATAPDLGQAARKGDAALGSAIFNSTCVICHGENGKGTSRAPTLNDPQRLRQLDDAWYRNTISKGRPAQGMPTWGTVLSPTQINDVLALIDSWRSAAPSTVVTSTQTTATQ